MEHTQHPSHAADRPWRVPPIVWFLGLGLLVALMAIFVFNVAINTVVSYGLIALMVGGHFFMHGSHGGHAGHGAPPHAPANPDGSASAAQTSPDDHRRHSGGCH